jgi:hypothetical protein
MRPLLLAALIFVAPAVRAEEAKSVPSAPQPAEKGPPRHNWELDLFAGYGQIGYPSVDTSLMSRWNGGPGFALSVAYRGPHFSHPFLDIAYVPILSSAQTAADPRTGATLSASNFSSALGFSVGPGFDIAWFRIRTGLSLYNVSVKANVDGVENSSSKLTPGFLLSAAGMVWRPNPFALGVEARLALLQAPTEGIYQMSWVIGLTGRWDFARH